MAKWLIRTHSNHLLGPVSKGKLRELMATQALSSKDEVCSGNGFWFHLSESDLVEKYIDGDEVQPFNPLSESEENESQTGIISLKNLVDSNSMPTNTHDDRPTPIQHVSPEHPLADHVPKPEQRVKQERAETQGQEQTTELASVSFPWGKVLLILVIMALVIGGYLLKDKIIELQHDLKFFETTQRYFSPIPLAHATQDLAELALKKK